MRLNPKSLFVMAVCLLLLGAVAAGQSGRKQKKADPQPVVQGVNNPETRTVPEPEVVAEKPKENEKDKGKAILVSTALTDIEVPMYYADVAREGCLNEFKRELKAIQLSSERNQHRSDAMKAAKESENTYVVWIELTYDRMGMGSMNGLDMRFTVFEPKTGKSIAFGTGYPRSPGGMAAPPIGASRDQVYIDWAGRDIAQQVIKRLGLRSSY